MSTRDNLRNVAVVAGLLGGICWVVRAFVDSGFVYWMGFVLIAVSLAAAGAGLVSGSLAWLAALVAVAFPVLSWSVLELVRDAGEATIVDAVFGAVVALAAAFVIASRLQTGTPSRH